MRAPVTHGLLIATVAAFLAGLLLAPPVWLAEQGGFVALRFSEVGPAGDFHVPAVLTPFSATLIHGGVLHLGMNMLMLFVCGRDTEAVLGSRALALIYVSGAIGAAAAQYAWEPYSPIPMIGASGAISAVIAAYSLLFGRNVVKLIGPIPAHGVRALWLAAGWIGVQLLLGLATAGSGFRIAIAAHIGGFLVGLALARPLLLRRMRRA